MSVERIDKFLSYEMSKMFKLYFFVHAAGWQNGGYHNVQYFETKRHALDWARRNEVVVEKLQLVTLEDFAEDYICSL